MRRIFGALALGAVLSLSLAATPAETGTSAKCQTTTDLSIGQDLGGTSQEMNRIDNANNISNISNSLTGTITNNSTDQGYENIEVKVDYFDDEDNAVGSETVKVRKDVDPGTSEKFTANIHSPAGATSASYSIACAEQDRGWVERLQFWR